MKRALVIIFILTQVAVLTNCSGGNPISDFEYGYDTEHNGVVITNYVGNTIKVRIPEKIEGEPVTGISKAFAQSGISDVQLSNNIMYIGVDAFNGCKGLTNITIPDSVTAIDSRAFANCTGLTSIVIPDSVTSIGEHAFADCTSLTSITIPDSVVRPDVEIYKNYIMMGTQYSFLDGCAKLVSITYKGNNYSSVKEFEQDFFDYGYIYQEESSNAEAAY